MLSVFPRLHAPWEQMYILYYVLYNLSLDYTEQALKNFECVDK